MTLPSSPRDPRLTLRPLVFDLDGTLIDSRRDIASAVNAALREAGREPFPVETVTRYVGRGAKALLRDLLPETTDEEVEHWFQKFCRHYVKNPAAQNTFMPGARAALALGSTRLLALCTNKPMVMTQSVLECLEWQDCFDVVVAPSESEKKKPDKEPLLQVSRALGVQPSRLIMIGDSPPDVGAGKAAGAVTVGVLGGFVAREVLVDTEPDFLLESLDQLPALLLREGL